MARQTFTGARHRLPPTTKQIIGDGKRTKPNRKSTRRVGRRGRTILERYPPDDDVTTEQG